MKNLIMVISAVMLFTQCNQNNNIVPSNNTQLIEDELCENSGFYTNRAPLHKLNGDVIIDYSSYYIDSSRVDSVFGYLNVSIEINIDSNIAVATEKGIVFIIPTHLIFGGGTCVIPAASNSYGSLSYVRVTKFIDGTIITLKESDSGGGYYVSSAPLRIEVFARPRNFNDGDYPGSADMEWAFNSHRNNGFRWWMGAFNVETKQCVGGLAW